MHRVFFGFVYAFAGTGVAQLLFGHQANGSITANGSTLIGQNWAATNAQDIPSAVACSTAAPTTPAPTPRRLQLQRKELHAELRW